jgi:predicted membrane chloride channel (bestrophin family)
VGIELARISVTLSSGRLMDNKLDELAHVLGGCERLATTPVPFAYTLILPPAHRAYCPSARR